MKKKLICLAFTMCFFSLVACDNDNVSYSEETSTTVETTTEKVTESQTPVATLSRDRMTYTEDVTYEMIARYPDKYINKTIKYNGKVIQVLGNVGKDYSAFRMAVDDDYNKIIYVVYYNDIDTKNYNIELVFEDMMTYSEGQRYEYTVSLDFASIDQDNALTFNPMLTIERNDNVIVSANTFGLTGLMSVVDSFGNQLSKDVDNKGNNVSNYDTYYKVILNYTKNETNQEKVFYSNVQNYNLAQFLFENIKENRNYKLTIIDRFESSLSFNLSVNKDIYDMKLTTDDFNAESESVGEGVQYVLIPSKLNSHNEDFTFYAKELSLVDNTAKTTVVYTLNSRGEIDSYLDVS